MIGGSSDEVKERSFLHTGLGAMVPHTVNPSNEEYKRITKSKPPFELSYSPFEVEYTEQPQRVYPISILCHMPKLDIFKTIRIYVGDYIYKSKTGKVRYIDDKGNMSHFAKSPEEVSYINSATSRPLKKGMYELYNLLQAYCRYSPKAEKAQWMKDMEHEQNRVTAEALSKGDTGGLKGLIKEGLNNQNWSAAVLLTARHTPDKKRSFTQSYDLNYCYRTRSDYSIEEWVYEAIEKSEKKQREKGYDLSMDLYTIDLMEFDIKKVRNRYHDLVEKSTDGDTESAVDEDKYIDGI